MLARPVPRWNTYKTPVRGTLPGVGGHAARACGARPVRRQRRAGGPARGVRRRGGPAAAPAAALSRPLAARQAARSSVVRRSVPFGASCPLGAGPCHSEAWSREPRCRRPVPAGDADDRPARLIAGAVPRRAAGLRRLHHPRRAGGGGIEPGFDPCLDGWLQGAGYVTAAVLALLRPFASRVDRAIWAWLAAAITARAAGLRASSSAYVRWQEPPPYPSVADAAWLAMYVLMLAGLVELARRRTRRLSTTLVLDAAVGVLAAAAVAVALLYRTVLSLAAPGTPGAVVVVNLAYPVLDLMLLVVFVGVLLAYEWHPPPAAWVLAAGRHRVRGDRRRLRLPVRGGDVPARDLLSSVALAAMGLVAVAGWLPGDHGPSPGADAERRAPRHLRAGLPRPAGLRHAATGPVAGSSSPAPAWRWPSRAPGCRSGRSRPGRAPAGGAHRRAHRAGQPAGVQRDPGAGAGPPAGGPPAGAARRGPRRLQGGQRLARPPLRGRAPPADAPRIQQAVRERRRRRADRR